MKIIRISAALATLPAVLAAPPGLARVDPAEARAVFDQARAVCEADAGALWGVSLCGPLILADPDTRRVAASQADEGGVLTGEDGVFTGTLPPDVAVANTALEWSGVRWAMLVLPLPGDGAERGAMIAHESWHRIQDRLGLPMTSPAPAHLGTVEGRLTMRLEWRALAAALSAPDAEAMGEAIREALLFRAARHGQAGPQGADEERQLELNEGLAEYTGVKLGGAPDPHRAVAAALRAAEGAEAYARMFAYASGPAYGLLLDDVAPGWREGLTAESDLGALLAEAVGFEAPEDMASAFQRAGALYAAQDVLREETAAQGARMEREARWTARLVDGPVLHLPFQSMRISFDPGALSPLPPHGVVYPTLTVTDAWGVLRVDDGALIDGAWRGVTVAAPDGAEARAGEGWTLDLAEGWRLAPGERAGDFRLERTD